MRYVRILVRVSDIMPKFSRREHEVLEVLWRWPGARNKEIARQLGIREGTAKVHLRSIMLKLNLKAKAEIVAWLWWQSERAERSRSTLTGSGLGLSTPSLKTTTEVMRLNFGQSAWKLPSQS